MKPFLCKRTPWAAVFVAVLLFCVFPDPIALAAQEIATPAQGGLSANQAGLLEESGIVLDAAYGYQGIAKSGRFLPITVTLENTGTEAFSGYIEVRSMEADYEVYAYDYQIHLAPGERLEQTISVSVGAGVDQMYVQAVRENGSVAARKRLKIDVQMDTAELFVGVLSDTPDELQYLGGVGINYGVLRTRVIALSNEMLPQQEQGLDQLDVLLISDFDTRTLSSGQVEAIWQWVQKGGVLLFGVGDRAGEVLGAFADRILERPLDAPQLREINMGVEYAKDSPKEAVLTLESTELFLKGGQEVLSSDALSVLIKVPVDSGVVAGAIYDFGDIAAFGEDNPTYVERLFSELLGDQRIAELTASADATSSGQYWSIQTLINTGDINRLPQVGLYALAACAYVALAGPGIYFFLRQRKLTLYYPVSVIAISLCCGGLIYVMGTTTRFHGPFLTYATIRDVGENSCVETTFVNIRTPYNRAYQIAIDPQYQIQPVTRSAYYYYNAGRSASFSGNETPAVNLRFLEDRTMLEVQKTGAFQPKYFSLEKKNESEAGAGFIGNLSSFDGKVYGTLTNNSGSDLEDVAILLYNQMVSVGSMKAGETVTLSREPVTFAVFDYSYPVAEQITGASRFKEGNLDDIQYVYALERSNLLSFYLDNYMAGYRDQARVIGFTQEKDGEEFLAQGGETYGCTLITSALEVNDERGDLVYRSGLQKEPQVLSGEYDADSNTMYGETPLILEYYLGNGTEVERVSFHEVSEGIAQSLSYLYAAPFEGNVYFYNYDTGNYDAVNLAQENWSASQLRSYLSPGNTLTVKYVSSGSDEYSWNVVLPIVTVIGRRTA